MVCPQVTTWKEKLLAIKEKRYDYDIIEESRKVKPSKVSKDARTEAEMLQKEGLGAVQRSAVGKLRIPNISKLRSKNYVMDTYS